MTAPGSSSQAVVVLGMHRSGTSALAGLLGLLGVDLGSKLMNAPAAENPKGFWEHTGILDIQQSLLVVHGSDWDDPRPLPEGWCEDPLTARLQQDLLACVREEFAGKPLWGFKDPRTCRLLPLWRSVFAELGCLPRYIIMLRHPCEVALSLERRNNMPRPKAHLLWLQHLLSVDADTRGAARVVVTFDQLLADWRGTMDGIARALGLSWPRSLDAAAAEVEQFLDGSLRHHGVGDDVVAVEPELPALVRTAWVAALAAIRPGEPDRLGDALAPVRAEYAAHPEFSRPWLDAAAAEAAAAPPVARELVRTKVQLRDHESLCAALRAEKARLDARLLEYDTLCRARGAEIERLNAKILEYDALCRARGAEIEGLNAKILEYDALCRARGTEIEKLNARILEYDALCRARGAEIEQLNARISGYNAEVERLAAQVRALEDTQRAQAGRIEQLQAQIAGLQDERARIVGGASFRIGRAITAPVRLLLGRP